MKQNRLSGNTQTHKPVMKTQNDYCYKQTCFTEKVILRPNLQKIKLYLRHFLSLVEFNISIMGLVYYDYFPVELSEELTHFVKILVGKV